MFSQFPQTRNAGIYQCHGGGGRGGASSGGRGGGESLKRDRLFELAAAACALAGEEKEPTFEAPAVAAVLFKTVVRDRKLLLRDGN